MAVSATGPRAANELGGPVIPGTKSHHISDLDSDSFICQTCIKHNISNKQHKNHKKINICTTGDHQKQLHVYTKLFISLLFKSHGMLESMILSLI